MRPGNQNNKRMRGRGRKGPNPLTRTFESNGPDVKIRGTAMHVAEKYQQLARDAQASGDRIMSENYNQHAEHYLRIVAAAQPTPQQNVQPPARQESEDSQEQSAVSSGVPANNSDQPPQQRGGSEAPVVGTDSPQPFIEDMPVIDQEGQVNGSGQKGGADAAENEEKPRRRARTPRTPRPRAPRRTVVEATPAGDADSGPEVAKAAEATSEEEAQPKPRRRAPRPRKPKTTDDTPAETVAASE